MGELTPEEREAQIVDDVVEVLDTTLEGWPPGVEPAPVVTALVALVAAHVARATADAEARLAAARALHSGIHWCFGGGDHREANVYEQGTEWWPCPTLATLDPAPTTDAEVCEHGFRPEPGRCPAGCTVATHTRYGLLAPTTDAEVCDERRDGAGARALRDAADLLPALTEGESREGTATWNAEDRAIYSLAIEEAQAALRSLATEADQ